MTHRVTGLYGRPSFLTWMIFLFLLNEINQTEMLVSNKIRTLSMIHVYKTSFIVMLILVGLSILWAYWVCYNGTPEFEHYLQKEVLRQMDPMIRNGSTSSLIHHSRGLTNDLIKIYEEQLARFQAAAFLPTHQNHRLKLIFNRSAIVMDLYGNISHLPGSTRDLHIICFESDVERFHVTLRFVIKSTDNNGDDVIWEIPRIHFPFLVVSSSTAETIAIDVRRRFSINTIFTFTHQWSDLKVSNILQWPNWPLQKSCLDNIANDHRPIDSARFFPCLTTHTLEHSTSRQLFFAEQTAVQHWLDIQYSAKRPNRSMPTRRLTPFEASLNTTVCSRKFSSWVHDYQVWHANISYRLSNPSTTPEQHRAGVVKDNLRFILYETLGSGAADRIVHLITTYLIAIFTKRVFLFDGSWVEFPDVVQSILNDNVKDILPWFSPRPSLNRGKTQLSPNYLSVRVYRFGTERLTNDIDYEKKFRERIVIVRAHAGGLTHMIVSNSSIYRKFLTEDLQIDAENCFGCLYHSFLIHRLSALIERTSRDVHSQSSQQPIGHSAQLLLQILLSPAYFPLGVQVRAGDDHMASEIKSSSLSDNIFLKSSANSIICARHFADSKQVFFKNTSRIPIALLISDVFRLRQTVLKRWQYPSSCLDSSDLSCPNQTSELHFIANPDPILHIAHTNQRRLAFNLAMFDIFLFGLCEQHIISHDSGFGRIGVFASLKQRNIFSLSPREYLFCSNTNQSISLLQSAYDWSGI